MIRILDQDGKKEKISVTLKEGSLLGAWMAPASVTQTAQLASVVIGTVTSDICIYTSVNRVRNSVCISVVRLEKQKSNSSSGGLRMSMRT